MDFQVPGLDDPRRQAVREWLAKHPNPTGRQLAEAGYVAPHWPEPYGLGADPFHPRDNIRQSSQRVVQHTETPRFFDDYDHMLSVIGLIRFAMGIPENIVESNELYEVEELPKALDP